MKIITCPTNVTNLVNNLFYFIFWPLFLCKYIPRIGAKRTLGPWRLILGPLVVKFHPEVLEAHQGLEVKAAEALIGQCEFSLCTWRIS